MSPLAVSIIHIHKSIYDYSAEVNFEQEGFRACSHRERLL